MSVIDYDLHGHQIKGRYFASDDSDDMPKLLKSAARWAKENRNRVQFLDLTFRQSEGTDLGDSLTLYYEDSKAI